MKKEQEEWLELLSEGFASLLTKYPRLSEWEFGLGPYPTITKKEKEMQEGFLRPPRLVRPNGMFVAVLNDTVGNFEFFNFMTISSSRQETEDKLSQIQKQIPEFFRHCVPQRIAEIRVEEL